MSDLTRAFSRGRSLTRQLTLLLVAATILVWLASAVVIYGQADRESNELFDNSLAEMGHALLTMALRQAEQINGRGQIADEDVATDSHSQFLFYQIWDADERLFYRSRGAPAQRLAPASQNGFAWQTIDGKRWRVYAVWSNDHRLQIQVGEHYTHRREISTRFAWMLAALALVLLPTLGLIVWRIVGHALSPIRQSAGALARRSEHELSPVVADDMPVEVRPLFEAINRLFGKIGKAMSQQQRFTADAAHELRTPLAGVRANAQLLSRMDLSPKGRETCVDLLSGVDRCTRLVSQLLQLAGVEPMTPGTLRTTSVSADRVIVELMAEQQARLAAKAIRSEVDATPASLDCEPGLFEMLMRNLIDNAIRYVPPGSRIRITCARTQAGGVHIEVSDDGPGIAPALRERVFDRFFRIPGSHEPGSGLGLSIVRQIADLHGIALTLTEGLDGRGLGVHLRWSPPILAPERALRPVHVPHPTFRS